MRTVAAYFGLVVVFGALLIPSRLVADIGFHDWWVAVVIALALGAAVLAAGWFGGKLARRR